MDVILIAPNTDMFFSIERIQFVHNCEEQPPPGLRVWCLSVHLIIDVRLRNRNIHHTRIHRRNGNYKSWSQDFHISLITQDDAHGGIYGTVDIAY